MVTIDDLPELLTPSEAAKALRVTDQTIRRMLREGELVGVRVGKRWVVAKDSIRELLRPITVELAGGRTLFMPPLYGRDDEADENGA